MDTQEASRFGEHRVRRDLFVVRRQKEDFDTESRQQVEKCGAATELKAYPRLLLLHVDAPSADKTDVRATWERLQNQLGDGFDVYPVIIDEEGKQKYPVGKVVVRFKEPPSDEVLEELADEHELAGPERNEFSAKQVAFEAGRKFLPDILEKLKDSKAQRSWVETISAYDRGA